MHARSQIDSWSTRQTGGQTDGPALGDDIRQRILILIFPRATSELIDLNSYFYYCRAFSVSTLAVLIVFIMLLAIAKLEPQDSRGPSLARWADQATDSGRN